MVASDLKLLSLVFREHLHYNKYITMTTYANCTISKIRVNNLDMKNTFKHDCVGFIPPRLSIQAQFLREYEKFHEQIATLVDSSGKQCTRTQFHTGDQTGPVFIWNVGVVPCLWNLRKKLSVYLHMCMFFKKAKRRLYNIHIFLSSKYVLKKLEKQYGHCIW